MTCITNKPNHIVAERKPPIFPISVLGANFNPQNTICIPAVKILARLELEKIFRFSFTHHITGFCLCIFLFSCLVKPDFAQGGNIGEYEIKGAMIVNFIRFSTWPDPEQDTRPDTDIEARNSLIVIGVMGNRATFDAFAPMQRLRVNGRRLSVRHIDAVYQIAECQVLFVDKSRRFRIAEVMDAVDGLPILTVGETKDFIKSGGLICFYLHNGHIKFKINGKAAEKSRVRIGSKLMEIGKIVY